MLAMFNKTPNTVDSRVKAAVDAFCLSVDGGADLAVHRQVDNTVDALTGLRRMFEGQAAQGRVIVNAIEALTPKPGQMIDPDGRFHGLLDDLVDRIERLLTQMTARKGCIDRDPALTSAHCDMLHVSFDETLRATACLINVAIEIREVMLSHDIDAEPRRNVYSSVEDMAAALRN